MSLIESDRKETQENPLKTKALQLINQMYEMAGKRKSVNNLEGESQIMYLISGMEEMAQNLDILTKEEVGKIKNEYWAKRNNIPLDFPDRF